MHTLVLVLAFSTRVCIQLTSSYSYQLVCIIASRSNTTSSQSMHTTLCTVCIVLYYVSQYAYYSMHTVVTMYQFSIHTTVYIIYIKNIIHTLLLEYDYSTSSINRVVLLASSMHTTSRKSITNKYAYYSTSMHTRSCYIIIFCSVFTSILSEFSSRIVFVGVE